MSMIGNIVRVEPAELEILFRSPEKIEYFLYGEEPKQPRQSWIVRAANLLGRNSATHTDKSDILSVIDDESRLDIDKSWNTIHFALTGTADGGEIPAAFLLKGIEIGTIDVGYGPARGFSPEAVSEINRVLTKKTANEWVNGIDTDVFAKADIYPFGGDGLSEEDKSYVASYLQDLKRFVSESEKHGKALVIYLN